MLSLILFGLFFGFLIFLFTLIASKKNGAFYFAPLVTFLSSVLITAYGLFKIGGFEGMAYGFLGAGLLIVATVGVLLLPLITRKMNKRPLNRADKSILIISPFLFFVTIGLIFFLSEDYWVIDQGVKTVNAPSLDSYYTVSTISEGSKQISILFGEKYAGKKIKIKKVSKLGNTEIMLKVEDGNEKEKTPFLNIGIDSIVEPLEIRTADGDIIKPKNKNN
ncbi:hypothetical protein [Bacillus sp. 1P06AnD]|uniref:hypothetical protein n=1 Tax=Bacillus sp. 1P06AnD TaxID=3132208 RepID=UPI0039A3D224